MAKRVAKVYLDTSVVSALFDARMPDRKKLTEDFWNKLGDYDVYFSSVGKEEIDYAPDELKVKILGKIREFKTLEVTEEVKELADEYMKRGIFPKLYKDDAVHVAVAVANDVDLIVSWNYKHLVKVKTRRMVNLVNEILGYHPVEIIAPPEL